MVLGTLANKRCISRLNQLHKIIQHQTSAIEMPTYHLSIQYLTRQLHQYHFIISVIDLCHCISTVSFQKPSRNGIFYQAKSLRLLLHYLSTLYKNVFHNSTFGFLPCVAISWYISVCEFVISWVISACCLCLDWYIKEYTTCKSCSLNANVRLAHGAFKWVVKNGNQKCKIKCTSCSHSMFGYIIWSCYGCVWTVWKKIGLLANKDYNSSLSFEKDFQTIISI